MIHSSGNEIVDNMARWNPTGIVIPHTWFQAIQKSGKPYMPAIVALAEIVYWYRPSIVKDEETGQLVGYKKRFKADKLQKSASGLADTFGFTKKQMLDAMNHLKKNGLISIELRTITAPDGKRLNNVRYIEIDMKKIEEMTYPITYKSQGYDSQVTGLSPVSHTNTKITYTKNTSTNDSTTSANSKNEFQEVHEFYLKCGWGLPSPFVIENLIADIEDYSKDVVIHAMKIAAERNAKSYSSYTKAIFREWSQQQLTTIEQVVAYEQAKTEQHEANRRRNESKNTKGGKRNASTSKPVKDSGHFDL